MMQRASHFSVVKILSKAAVPVRTLRLLAALSVMGGSSLTYAASTANPVDLTPPGPPQAPLELVAQSPKHLWNAVVVTHDGRIFAGMPRWPGYENTPGLVEVKPDGSLVPYPGGSWNTWHAGADPKTGLIQVNAVNAFDGHTLWVVDQGTPPDASAALPGGQKLVAIDTDSNQVVRTIHFDRDVLPPGAALNDIRIHGDWAYLTESGLGSVVVVNLTTGKITRRLADNPTTKQVRPKIGHDNHWFVLPNGKVQVTNADPIELSPDGSWLYYQPASGPLYKVPTAALRDPAVSEAELGREVQFVYDTPTLGGTAMDSKGNLYLAQADMPRVTVLSPDGSLRVLAEDDRLWGSDALFITQDGYLYLPVPQVPNLKYLQGPGGKDRVKLPFKIWRMKLPADAGGPLHP